MKRRLVFSLLTMLLSLALLSTSTYAWFAMNTRVSATGMNVQAATNTTVLEIATVNDDDEYDYSTIALNNIAIDLLPITWNLTPSSGMISLTATEATGAFDSSKQYYKKDGENLIAIGSSAAEKFSVAGMYDDIEFIRVSGLKSATDSNAYYKQVGNNFVKQTTSAGTPLDGMYILSHGEALSSGATYDITKRYFRLTTAGDFEFVNDREVPSGALYTVSSDAVTSSGSIGAVYYVKNGNDYVGIKAASADLANQLYWGYAYSDKVNDVKSNATLTVTDLSKHYLANTFYLRVATGSDNAVNLRVDNARVNGTEDAGEYTNAMRILFVAETTNSDGTFVSYCLFDRGEDTYTYYDENKEVIASETFFDGLELTAGQVVEMDTYIFFDGTDEKCYTENVGATYNHDVAFDFVVDIVGGIDY